LNHLPRWQTPCTLEGSQTQLVIPDGQGKVYVVGLKADPQPRLAALAQSDALPVTLVTGAASAGQMTCVAAVDASLLSFHLPDMKRGPEVRLGTPPAWGPERVGDQVLLATEDDQLVCMDGDGAERWRRALAHGPLAGTPLVENGQFTIPTTHGFLWRVALETGDETSAVDLGQPLASGPVRFGQRIIVAAHDSTLLIMKHP
jgi:hypothetical protein